jgi:hypothetical protein
MKILAAEVTEVAEKDKNKKDCRRKGEDGEMEKKELKKELGHRFTQMNTDKCNKILYPIFLCLSVSNFIFHPFSFFPHFSLLFFSVFSVAIRIFV